MTSYRFALASARQKLADVGIGTAALDARLLLAAASGLDAAALIARDSEPLPPLAIEVFDAYLKRRLAREPVSRILGEKEFYGLPFRIGAATLVPRAETEILVETVLAELRERRSPRPTICDLGAGSGAILISLMVALPGARGVAVDISDAALDVARENADRLGVASRISFHRGDFGTGLAGLFDVVVSNPPYIRSDAIEDLEPEVRMYDPRVALDGGADGLDAYRAILSRVPELLAPRGLLAFEVGHDQSEPVSALCLAAGLNHIAIRPDLAGIARVVTAQDAKSQTAMRRKNRLEKSGSRASFRLANQ